MATDDFEDFIKKVFGNTPNGSEKTGTVKPGSEKLNTTRPDDSISHPSHYTFGKVESIDLMESVEGRKAVADFCICNCWKYLYRHNHKNNDISDMRKLVWYANKYIELMGGNTDADT